MQAIAAHIRQSGAEVWIDAAEVDEMPLNHCRDGNHAQPADIEGVNTADPHRSIVTHRECCELGRDLIAEEMVPARADRITTIEVD